MAWACSSERRSVLGRSSSRSMGMATGYPFDGMRRPGGDCRMPFTSLVRPRSDRVLAGVCAALARRFGTSPTVVRVLFVVSIVLPGPQVLLYAALWLLIPSE
jgi:phage shock protein PspC (stress-responsive transcriptional regulator)